MGTGDHLKRIFRKLGFKMTAGCNCQKIVDEMNADGPETVRARIHYYADRILQNANRQQWDFEAAREGSVFGKLLSASGVVTISVTPEPIKRRVAKALIQMAAEKASKDNQ